MSEQIKVTHGGIEIVYFEVENKWRFTLRGRERSTDSLQKAKELIDKPVKEKKEFTRIKAWYKQYSTAFKQVEVTSIAEGRSYDNSIYFWIMVPSDDRRGKPDRQKVRDTYLFPCNAKNDAVIAEYNELVKQREAISLSMEKVEEKLKPIEVEKEEEVE